MAQVQKYGFHTEFAPDGKILHDGNLRRRSEEEIDSAAYERGKNDALAQAEREAAAALQALADAASAILTGLNAESRAMREEAARIAAMAARKIAGAALDQFGAEHASAAIEAAMEALRHQPRLVVKLAPAAATALGSRIEQMCQTHAYAGAVLVRSDPALGAGEVTIDWSEGGVAHSPQHTAQTIDRLVEAALAAADAAPGAEA